jgi:branched-chain amino acid transport system permease protein
LPQAVASFQDFKHLVFGGILIATMIFLPKGLVPSLADLARRFRR